MKKKKKKKNQARKSITAVGAVVAAGLTPGIATGAPAPESLSPDMNLTAADAVSINGDVYDFDDLFAVIHADPIPVDQLVVLYGSPNPKKDKNKDKKKQKDKDKKIREQEIADSLQLEEMMQAERDRLEMEQQAAMLEQAREDSIRRAQALVYGPPPPQYKSIDPEQLRSIATNKKSEAFSMVMRFLMEFCYMELPSVRANREVPFKEDVDLVRSLKLEPEDQQKLIQEIESRTGVQLDEEMFKQLATPRSIAIFITEVIAPVKKD